MPRLPKPGGDAGNWGELLNEFLTVEHTSDGKLNPSGTISLKYTKPETGIPKTDLEASLQADINKIPTHDTTLAAIQQDGWVTRDRLAEDVAGSVNARGVGAENVTPLTMAKWRKAVAKVRTGDSDAKLLCVGDSTTWGSHTSDVFTNAYPTRLASMLDRNYVPAGVGMSIPADISNTDVGDPRWSVSGAWVLSDWGFGARASYKIAKGHTSDALTFTPGYPCDTFRIWFQLNTGLGSLRAKVDDGEVVTGPLADGPLGWGSFDVSTTLADDHTLTLKGSDGGTVAVVGVEAWDSSSKRVLVGRAGLPGYTSGQWSTIPAWRSEGIFEYAPDLSVISLGINDSKTATPVATEVYLSHIDTIISRCQLSGDVVLMSFVPSNLGATQVAAQEAYWVGLRSLAYSRGCAFVDIASRFGPAPTADSLGLMADVWHPNALGYLDMASAVYAAITQI